MLTTRRDTSLRTLRRTLPAAIAALFICLLALPALAHDDDAPSAPPDPKAQAAQGQVILAALSLAVGFAVYYGVERHVLTHSSEHPPQWEATMNRRAIWFAVAATIIVWIISAALSRPARGAPQAGAAASSPAPAPGAR